MEKISVINNQYISTSPDIRFGKSVITGTRITVEDVLKWIENGMTTIEIQHDFPELNLSQINACLEYGETFKL